MFKKFTLRNYKTHRLTSIKLKAVTLLIGNNSSGKTNLLSGIQHFASLVRRGNPATDSDATVRSDDYFSCKHRLAAETEPLSIEVIWSKNNSEIIYTLELYTNNNLPGNVGCREKIMVKGTEPLEIEHGFKESSQSLDLRKICETSIQSKHIQKTIDLFFQDFATTFSYHLQPSFLKGYFSETNQPEHTSIKIPGYLGYEGSNLIPILLHIKEKEERIFSRFLVLMRRLNSSFQGVRWDRGSQSLIWEFDLGRSGTDRIVEEFTSDSVSDGLIKAAALALLVSLRNPPGLILMEEIENGINPGNIQEIMDWIWQATASPDKSKTPQFILTTHSPSVLREFHNHLDCVYITRLQKKGFQSDVRNLSQALDTLIGIGTVEGEVFTDPNTGEFRVEMPKYQLAELWYSGTIG